MKKALTLTFCLMTLIITGCASTSSSSSVAEKRQATLQMKDETLTQLYRDKPDVREQINSAAGYAVFSNANVNVIFIAAGGGYGVARNMRTKQYTYMNMAEAGVGLGFGAKDYRIVMVFHTEKALNQFIESGWTFGGNADAAAKAGDKGGSVEGEAYYGDVTVYTFTEAGLALQATVKGTKFWKDSELN
ncbi:YSC84-related protein [Aestuariibacter salexigens]|uniref:lipid-binding SYLF domain-containing protein n=1 Tax=Aestuariibacter salexigens TaxID=226010 RepID=UPI0004209EE3|nr:YSC84-related protein [Aestuariibacter salexigens]